MKIMVSACLLGENCKYSGGNNLRPELLRLLAGHTVIPVCPEILGGLPTPRIPAEIVNGTVINREGQSVDAAFRLGAEKALETALREKPDLIILQSRSPSCGVREVYDGTFSGKKIPGRGIFAELAVRAGFRVMDAEDILTDFSAVTACGECCTECPKKKDGRCPGCIEADGRVPEWAESGRCKIHACTREHHVRFCGLCGEFPCGRLPSLAHWNPGIVERMTALRDAVLEVGKMKQGSPLNDSAAVHQQYSTPDRLNTRISRRACLCWSLDAAQAKCGPGTAASSAAAPGSSCRIYPKECWKKRKRRSAVRETSNTASSTSRRSRFRIVSLMLSSPI